MQAHTYACMLSCWVVSNFFVTPWTVTHQAPCWWDFPSKNTGVGCHFLLQGIFLTHVWSNPTSPALPGRFFPTEPPGKPPRVWLSNILIWLMRDNFKAHWDWFHKSLTYIFLITVVISILHISKEDQRPSVAQDLAQSHRVSGWLIENL